MVAFCAVVAMSGAASAAWRDYEGKVSEISVWTASGGLLVRMRSGNYDVSGLACSSGWWLYLNQTDVGYTSTLKMLMAAQVADRTVRLRGDDTQLSGDFCKLSRVTML